MAWDGSPGRFTDEQYARSCILDRGAASGLPVNQRYSLPVREPDGTLNCDAVASARRLVGKVKASPELIAAARAKLEKLAAQCQEKRMRPEQRTVDVQEVHTEGRTLHGYAALYDHESRDLGNFTERIERGAFAGCLNQDVLLTFNHNPEKVLARTTSGTLRLSDEERGLAFEADLGDSPTAQDVRSMVSRGDVTGCSFRFTIADGGERWDGEKRTLTRIQTLHDLSLATVPAYDGPSVELRSQSEQPEEAAVPPEETRQRGGLAMPSATEDRVVRGLADEFRARGFPGERATMPWAEYEARAIVWSGTTDALAPAARRQGAPLGADQRYIWPAMQRVGVGADITSVPVMKQTARSLAEPSDTIRELASTDPKPETGSTFDVVDVSLQQVATVQSGIPNIYLLQPTINSTIEVDLRLALNDALDALVLAAVATAPNADPGTDPLLTSLRNAIETLTALGYTPDTLILDPATAVALDLSKATTVAGEEWYIFTPGQAAPSVWGLNRRVATKAAGPVVLDSAAFGKLYASPVSLARFEENAGSTNSSLIRLELTAAVGVERVDAALRIAPDD